MEKSHTVIVRQQPPLKCEYCGEVKELRPYGKNGESICFKCAMKPENKEDTKAQFSSQFPEGTRSNDHDDWQECERCHEAYLLRDGEEPTRLCDHCAHLENDELRAEVKALWEDKERLDWLDKTRVSRIYDQFKFNDSDAARQKSWRAAIDAARKAT